MIILVYGTRPEAIKLGPVAAELRSLGLKPYVICTGQHTDLLQGTPAETDMSADLSLGLPSDGHIVRWLARAERALGLAFEQLEPKSDVVVVQGDTMSALAGAHAAMAKGLVLAHVEAGVRSHNPQEPFPEEGFRVSIDSTADWFYAPTSTAYANLVAEKAPTHRILMTGNTSISALARYSDAKPRPAVLPHYLIVTMHRREWLQSEYVQEVVAEIAAQAIARPELQVVWPIHPALKLGQLGLNFPENLKLVPPLHYRDMTKLIAGAKGVISDSGGLAEEAPALGVPIAIMRKEIDRPEAVEAGLAKGFSPTAQGIQGAFKWLCNGAPRIPTTVFGDSTAARQVARHLASL